MASLTRAETWSLLGLVGASVAVLANTFEGDGAPLVASLAFSGLGFACTYAFIQWAGPAFMKAGLKGKDLGKAVQKEM
jgi:UDP-N-acetylglucosamine--dolichyl-phosphate N-acetylglucosaminephosphotransferase